MCKMSRAAFPYYKRDDMILPMNMGGLENWGLACCQHGGDVFFPGVCMSKPGLGYADGRAGSKAAAVGSRLNHAIRTSGHDRAMANRPTNPEPSGWLHSLWREAAGARRPRKHTRMRQKLRALTAPNFSR